MELVDVYNKQHENLGYQKGRKELENGEYRLSVFTWIINDNDEILIQQRTKETKKLPNMWGASSAGGAQKNETGIEASLRETLEEIGLKLNKEDLYFIGSYARFNDFVEVYLINLNVKLENLNFDLREVQAIKWVSIDKFEEMLKNNEAIRSGYDIFRMYYEEYYNKEMIFENGKPIVRKISNI